jgi:hypothetical protein
LTACGTQTVADRDPVTSGAPPLPTETARTPAATTPVPVTPASTDEAPSTASAAPPATTPATVPDGGATPTVAGQDGGAAAGGSGTSEAPAGDEAGNRVPVSFTVAAGTATPATITVPPFLGILLRGTSRDGATHTITVRAPAPGTLAVPASGTVSRSLDGLPAGSYPVEVDGKAVATLRVADDAAGP